jgi:hypothetical protein
LNRQISTDKSMPTLTRWVLQVCTTVKITSRIPDALPVYGTDIGSVDFRKVALKVEDCGQLSVRPSHSWFACGAGVVLIGDTAVLMKIWRYIPP